MIMLMEESVNRHRGLYKLTFVNIKNSEWPQDVSLSLKKIRRLRQSVQKWKASDDSVNNEQIDQRL